MSQSGSAVIEKYTKITGHKNNWNWFS